jgi:hypothetical protein
MRTPARIPALALLVALTWTSVALANPMDITLSRFIQEDYRGGNCGEGTATSPWCGDVLDVDAFRNISRELGFAMSPFILSPPETLGYAGFYTGLAGQVTIIHSDEEYWEIGTEEMKPQSALFLTAVQARKGLPASFELGTTLGYMASTEQVVLGLDIKFSVFEGFRKKVGGGFPDMAIRAGVNQLIGEDELNLTTVGLDAAISWPITIMQQSTLTPFAGYQHIWIIADSEVVDGTPDRNFVTECGDPLLNDCGSGDVTDSNNMLDFPRMTIQMSRLMFGMRFIYEYFALTVQYSVGIPIQPRDKDDLGAEAMHQISFGVGADY